MDNPKISVIVPVYKVESYLRKCLDSIVGQTYKNLEIVLVDDGSPDGCGAICDEYAARDRRIRVIHQENGGLSVARNAGLRIASGEYLGFVDSDDWIEPEMYGYLLGRAVEHDADIAVCGQVEHWRRRCFCRNWDREYVFDQASAMEALLRNDVMQNHVWDKLWKRELFDGIRFPEGRTYEDIAILHRLFERAERVVCVPQAFYHYVQRPDGIMGTSSLENRMNLYDAAKRRLTEMSDQWPQFRPYLEAQCVASAVTIWCGCLDNSKQERERWRPQLREIAKFSKDHAALALRYLELGTAGRLVARLTAYDTWWSFALARGIGRLYESRHGRLL